MRLKPKRYCWSRRHKGSISSVELCWCRSLVELLKLIARVRACEAKRCSCSCCHKGSIFSFWVTRKELKKRSPALILRFICTWRTETKKDLPITDTTKSPRCTKCQTLLSLLVYLHALRSTVIGPLQRKAH